MDDDTGLLFDLPRVGRKKVSAAFDGGRLTSDGGVALLALADRRIGIVDRIAGLIADPRNPTLVTHSVASILRARVLAEGQIPISGPGSKGMLSWRGVAIRAATGRDERLILLLLDSGLVQGASPDSARTEETAKLNQRCDRHPRRA